MFSFMELKLAFNTFQTKTRRKQQQRNNQIINKIILFYRSWYKEAGISFLIDFRSSREAVVSHVIDLIQIFQVIVFLCL